MNRNDLIIAAAVGGHASRGTGPKEIAHFANELADLLPRYPGFQADLPETSKIDAPVEDFMRFFMDYVAQHTSGNPITLTRLEDLAREACGRGDLFAQWQAGRRDLTSTEGAAWRSK